MRRALLILLSSFYLYLMRTLRATHRSAADLGPHEIMAEVGARMPYIRDQVQAEIIAAIGQAQEYFVIVFTKPIWQSVMDCQEAVLAKRLRHYADQLEKGLLLKGSALDAAVDESAPTEKPPEAA